MDKKNMFSLEGKIALVTGGAHGIGFAIAESYAEAGATVVFNCSSEASLERGLAAYKEKGIDAHGYVCDVTDEEAVKKMIADIEEKIGTVDILVNNAGMIKRIPMHEMSADEFRKVVDVDLNAPFIMAKAVLPGMMKKKAGKIINICSMMSELGRETVSAYAAAKGGLKMLTRNICSEYGEYNIQCNDIIYYAVIVTKDLYGKKDDAKTTEEVFDVSNMADAEESITVEENNGGFSIGGNSYDTQVDAVADYGVGEAANKQNGYNDNIAEAGQEESDKMNGGYVGNETNASSGESGDTDKESAFEKLKAKMEEQLEETETYMSNPLTDKELYTAMIMRDPKLKWQMVKNEL